MNLMLASLIEAAIIRVLDHLGVDNKDLRKHMRILGLQEATRTCRQVPQADIDTLGHADYMGGLRGVGYDESRAPIDMLLFCPNCGAQHIDCPDPAAEGHPDGPRESCAGTWTNPPHRSHLCHTCGHIWRPADVPTNGVASITTVGKNDSTPIRPGPALATMTQSMNLAIMLLESDAENKSEDWKAGARAVIEAINRR